MLAIFFAILTFAFICSIGPMLGYIGDRQVKKEKERKFIKSIDNSFATVKKYCSKFGASIDHIKQILSVFEELVKNGVLNYLQPYEGYLIPTNQYHFPVYFYIIVSGDLQYKIIVTEDKLSIRDKYNEDISVEDSANIVKKYLPYAMTLEEFSIFVDECKEEYDKILRERKRRDHVDKIISKKIK